MAEHKQPISHWGWQHLGDLRFLCQAYNTMSNAWGLENPFELRWRRPCPHHISFDHLLDLRTLDSAILESPLFQAFSPLPTPPEQDRLVVIQPPRFDTSGYALIELLNMAKPLGTAVVNLDYSGRRLPAARKIVELLETTNALPLVLTGVSAACGPLIDQLLAYVQILPRRLILICGPDFPPPVEPITVPLDPFIEFVRRHRMQMPAIGGSIASAYLKGSPYASCFTAPPA